jgi:hypothetical protein
MFFLSPILVSKDQYVAWILAIQRQIMYVFQFETDSASSKPGSVPGRFGAIASSSGKTRN